MRSAKVMSPSLAALVLGLSALLLLLSLGALVYVSGIDRATPVAQAGAARLEEVSEQLTQARADLEMARSSIIATATGTEAARVAHDLAAGRALVLAISDTSASTRDQDASAALLLARYPGLDQDTGELDTFLTQWLSASDGASGIGTIYTVADLQTELSSIAGRSYTYTALATLEPVLPEDRTHQHFLVTYTTNKTGSITSAVAHLVTRADEAVLQAQVPTP